MPSSSGLANRKTTRYKGYDYTAPGAYFVTICTYKGKSILGAVENQIMVPSILGELALACWREIPEHHPHAKLDVETLMPNHFHGILWLHADPAQGIPVMRQDDAEGEPPVHTPVVRRFGESITGSLSTIIGQFKAAVTREARKNEIWPRSARLWHGRMWDRIVRNEAELQRFRDYILTNPARWEADKLHLDAQPNKFKRALLADE